MEFTDIEIADLESASEKNPTIKKLYEDWKESQEDIELLYKSAHKIAMKFISDGVKNENLSLKHEHTAAIMEFLVKAKPIREGMDALKTDEGGMPTDKGQIPRKRN